MNTLNKLISFGLVQLTNGLTVDKPNQIKYMYGFILWVALPLIGLIPALFVKEDLRRLNMKDVEKSVYLYEKSLMKETAEGRKSIMLKHSIIANDETLLYLQFEPFEEEKRRSMHVVS